MKCYNCPDVELKPIKPTVKKINKSKIISQAICPQCGMKFTKLADYIPPIHSFWFLYDYIVKKAQFEKIYGYKKSLIDMEGKENLGQRLMIGWELIYGEDE